MKGRSDYAYEKLVPCAAEPAKPDSYGLVSRVPYTPLPQYLPQLLPLFGHPHNTSFLTWDTGAQHPPTLLPVLLVWCYRAARATSPSIPALHLAQIWSKLERNKSTGNIMKPLKELKLKALPWICVCMKSGQRETRMS